MKYTRIRNFTPHTITVKTPYGDVKHIESEGKARVTSIIGGALGVGKFVVYEETVNDEVTGLPPPEDGVLICVSRMVAAHPGVAHRNDLVVPGKRERHEDGTVDFDKGVEGFNRIHYTKGR